MTRFIPREKLGKKARRQLDNRQRLVWPVPPATKTFAGKKDYNRRRKTHDYQNDWNRGFFMCTSGTVLGLEPV